MWLIDRRFHIFLHSAFHQTYSTSFAASNDWVNQKARTCRPYSFSKTTLSTRPERRKERMRISMTFLITGAGEAVDGLWKAFLKLNEWNVNLIPYYWFWSWINRASRLRIWLCRCFNAEAKEIYGWELYDCGYTTDEIGYHWTPHFERFKKPQSQC